MKHLVITITAFCLYGCATPSYVPSEKDKSLIKVANDKASLFVYLNSNDCSDRYKLIYDGSYTNIDSTKKVALTAFVEGKQGWGGYAFCPITFRFKPLEKKKYALIVGGKNDDSCEAILVAETDNSLPEVVHDVEFLVWNRGWDDKTSWCEASKSDK